MDTDFLDRLLQIRDDIKLAENFSVLIGRDREVPDGRYYFQIGCWRKDVITGEMGYGYGGKAYLSEHATDSELVQTIFGLYKGFYEHEARETFHWRDRRVFGPHIATEALWEVAKRVDVRSALHVEDRSEERENCSRTDPHSAHRPVSSRHPLCPGIEGSEDAQALEDHRVRGLGWGKEDN